MKTDDSSTRFSLRRPQDGAVLVVVLLAMIGLLGMGLAGLYLTSGNIQMNSNINMRNQALYVAEGGIQVAKGILNRPNSDAEWPDLNGMLAGLNGPSGAAVATPTGYTDEIPGRAGTDANDPGCSGMSSSGVSTRGAYLRDDDPPPAGFGCQTDASTAAQAVYIGCNYPPTYSYTDSNGNSISYNATPPDPNGMSATPTQYMGKYTLFIRQDLGECRQGGPNITQDINGIVVIRSEGTASDNRTKVVLEVTMSINPNVQILGQAIATVCPAGAAGCDDNSSVQQGITVVPPGAGGVSGSGGSGGTGGSPPCTGGCASGTICCNGACVDKTNDPNNCGACGTTCSSDPAKPFCCNGKCSAAAPGAISDKFCGGCGVDCTTHGQKCCDDGTNYACVDLASDSNNCAGCGRKCGTTDAGIQMSCCNGACCNGTCSSGHCCPTGQPWCNNTCCAGTCCNNACCAGTCCNNACCAGTCCNNACCTGTCTGGVCCPANSPCNNIALLGVFGHWGTECYANPQNTSQCVSSTGTTGFDAWLKTHTSLCNRVDFLTMADDPTSSDNWSKKLSQYQILIVLDLFHSPTEFKEFTTNPATGNTCNSNTAPCYAWNSGDTGTTGSQRRIVGSEVTDLQNWVKAGGGLMTTIGVGATASEYVSANMLLNPFNVYYTNYNSGYGFLLDLDHPRSCWITGGISTCTWQWITNPSLSMTNVANLRVDNGAPIMTLGSGPVLFAHALSTSNWYHTDNNGSGMAVDGNIGMIVDTPSLTGKGRVVVWSDEWVTYDHDWSANSAMGCPAEADTSTPYWDPTLNSCTQRFWNNIITWLRSASCP